MELSLEEMHELHVEILAILSEVCEKYNIPYFLCGGNVIGAVRHGGPIPWDYDTDVLIPDNQIDNLCKYLHDSLGGKFYVNYHVLDKKSKLIFPRIALSGYESKVFHVDIFRLVGLPDSLRMRNRMLKKANAVRFVLRVKRRTVASSSFIKSLFILLLKVAFAMIPDALLIKQYDKLCSKYSYDTAPYLGYFATRYGHRSIFTRSIFDEYTVVEYSGIPLRIVKNYDAYLSQLYGDYMQLPPIEEQKNALGKKYVIMKK